MSKKKNRRKIPEAQTVENVSENTADIQSAKPAEAKPYYAGIDILKILACFFVVGIHTFLYSGFYEARITSNDTQFLIPIAWRWITYTCVPIFMTVTGYLMKNKKLSLGYYKGLIRIIVIYAFVAIFCIRSNHEVFGFQYEAWPILRKFLEYNAADYGWYVNYYISLFCMIPFLNLAFNGLENKKQRALLLITIAAFTIFARSLFIGFEKDDQIKLLPDYLNGMWPIAYYYAGAFIRQYPPKKCLRNKAIILAVFAAVVYFITQSTFTHTTAASNSPNNYRMTSWHFNDYGTYPVFIMAVCIFLLLFDITTKNKVVKFILRQLSNATFAGYLISYVFDRKIYGDFGAKFPPTYVENGDYWLWNFDRWTHVWQPHLYVFLHAIVCGILINNGYKLLEFLITKAIKTLSSKKTAESKT